MRETIKAYLDLMRLHFFFVWPLLFCSGLFLAFQYSDGFSVFLLAKAALIGFFGFEAGFVLNDIVDAEIDKRDVEFDKLTKYWRPFGKRPISQGFISRRKAIVLFALLVFAAVFLILTLPYPHNLYVLNLMVICYILEVFYQMKKRNETFPVAQLIGRIDFTIFPVAGYLVLGSPDLNALLFALFFYPVAMAHLGVNDLADIANDEARGMKTIPILYGVKKTAYWVLLFTVIHYVTAALFLTVLGGVSVVGFLVGFSLLAVGNYLIFKGTSVAAIKALPFFHLSMLVYSLSIIAEYFV